MDKDLKNNVYNHLEKFAKNLKFERESRHLTQKDVADKLGIKTQSYQAYEGGISLPTTENLIKLSLIFDLSLDELFEIK